MYEKEKLNILLKAIGDYKKQGGNEYYFYCPYCKHHKKKLAINLEKNAFHCWVCDSRGKNIRRLLKDHANWHILSEWDRYTEQDSLNLEEQIFDSLDSGQVRENIFSLPKEYRFIDLKKRNKDEVDTYNYLIRRGVDSFDMAYWKIGHSSEKKFARRVFFPSFNSEGQINFYIARSIEDEDRFPRYLKADIKQDFIFNELFIDWNRPIYLVEGVFDAIKIGPNAIPILGSTLRKSSRLFKKIIAKDTEVYIGLDSDAKQKELQIIKDLIGHDIQVRKINTSGYEDIGEMPKKEVRRRINSAKILNSSNVFDYEIELFCNEAI